MKKNEKKIQTTLLIVGFLLILLTYFYFPYINKNKSLVEQCIEREIPFGSDDANESGTAFENLEYKGFYDFDKKFVVKSKKATVNQDDPDIVFMEDMHVILYLSDGRVVNILSDMTFIDNKGENWYAMDFTKNLKNSAQISIFYGSQKGGLICANGTCVPQPDFEDGIKLTFRKNF